MNSVSEFEQFWNKLKLIRRTFSDLISRSHAVNTDLKEYEADFKKFQSTIYEFRKCKGPLIDSLDLCFIEDVNKFERLVTQYFLKINDSFEWVRIYFGETSCSDEVVSNDKEFWAAYMRVQAKFYKVRLKETEIFRLDELGVYYIYTLDDFRVDLFLKYSQLTGKNHELFPHSLTSGKVNKEKPKNNFTHRQIAIAYFVMGLELNTENAGAVLREYSSNRSSLKLLSLRISSLSELSKLSGNKTADTKHLRNLEAAKRLISGKKSKNGIESIDRVITTFRDNYERKY